MYGEAVILYFITAYPIFGIEPECSKFHYEEQTLEKIIRQEMHVAKMKADVDETLKQVVNALADLKSERNHMSFDFNRMENVIKDTLEKYSEEFKKIEERIRTTGSVRQAVAFHAVGKHNKKHLGIHQSILFETVCTNIGTAFHVSHGTFKAPTHGIYLFSVSAPSEGTARNLVIATELVKDGTILAKTYSKSDTGYVDQGSVTVVAELQIGNEVWVRLNHPADTTLNAGYSSFTGVLLYEYAV